MPASALPTSSASPVAGSTPGHSRSSLRDTTTRRSRDASTRSTRMSPRPSIPPSPAWRPDLCPRNRGNSTGEIWWADLPEVEDSSPSGTRPVLVVQSRAFNRSRIQTAITAVITSNLSLASAPGNVEISPGESGLPPTLCRQRVSAIHHRQAISTFAFGSAHTFHHGSGR